MGACASSPKDLDRDLAPAPVPTEDLTTPKKPKGDSVPQEKKDGEETKKEEPLVDVLEAAETPKIEEVTTEIKVVVEETETVTKEETTKPAEEVKVEAVKEDLKEQQPVVEEKKEVAEKPKEAETAAQ